MIDLPELDAMLCRGLEKFEYDTLTDVQKRTLPMALKGDDLMVCAKTGSGKTLAFGLPSLQRLLTEPDNRVGTRMLVLAPVRELAEQIAQYLLQVASYTQLKVGLIVGGEDYGAQKRLLLKRNPEVIVATPGRLVDHLQAGNADLSALEVLVLDEADRMLDMGFAEQMVHVARACSRERQTLLFSASLDDKVLKGLAGELLRKPKTINVDKIRQSHEDIRQQRIPADDVAHKIELVSYLLQNETYQKALVFCNSRVGAQELEAALRRRDIRCGALHGDLEQSQRKQVVRRLVDGLFDVMVATDVAARGLDVKGIDLVVNFDVARNATSHLHRVGRTGRAGEQGLAVSLVDHGEWNLSCSIERYLRVSFDYRKIAGLEGQYRGPKKAKSDGRSVGKKKRKTPAGSGGAKKRSSAKPKTGVQRSLADAKPKRLKKPH